MAVPVGPDRGLGPWVIAVGPAVIASLVIVSVARARVQRWSGERRAFAAVAIVLTAGFVAAGAVVAGFGGVIVGALVGGCLAWMLWHGLSERADRV